ncbi:phosphopantetheine-binding protein [Allorhizocola rhizosphaerae]|uniref:phosphopantetheine-binding protein n=1 Tax=Allorhizocola rhizosphaerae TaxID=1872709 RepID=UPI000E3BD243|nr:phosphopantetheine-binding protein [Allorhizocola rhizosphaerae]
MNIDKSLVPDAATIEQRVGEIWRDVLGVPPGRDDATFFELQGQSIAAVRIVARIEDEVQVSVDASVLFEDPDLAAFARMVVAAAGGQA